MNKFFASIFYFWKPQKMPNRINAIEQMNTLQKTFGLLNISICDVFIFLFFVLFDTFPYKCMEKNMVIVRTMTVFTETENTHSRSNLQTKCLFENLVMLSFIYVVSIEWLIFWAGNKTVLLLFFLNMLLRSCILTLNCIRYDHIRLYEIQETKQ